MLDFAPQYVFAAKLPIVRRTKLHGVHIVISNSPAATYGDPQEELVLSAFDGRSGRTLRVPADAQTRIWVLADSPCN
jgi:hypothetical protein